MIPTKTGYYWAAENKYNSDDIAELGIREVVYYNHDFKSVEVIGRLDIYDFVHFVFFERIIFGRNLNF